MSIGILACESLLEYVEAAQEKLGTEYPVFVLDYSGDESPQQMRSRIIGITMLLPAEMDTVLLQKYQPYMGILLSDNACYVPSSEA